MIEIWVESLIQFYIYPVQCIWSLDALLVNSDNDISACLEKYKISSMVQIFHRKFISVLFYAIKHAIWSNKRIYTANGIEGILLNIDKGTSLLKLINLTNYLGWFDYLLSIDT